MKKYKKFAALLLTAAIICTGCQKKESIFGDFSSDSIQDSSSDSGSTSGESYPPASDFPFPGTGGDESSTSVSTSSVQTPPDTSGSSGDTSSIASSSASSGSAASVSTSASSASSSSRPASSASTSSSSTSGTASSSSSSSAAGNSGKGFSVNWKTGATWEDSGKKCGTVEFTITNNSGSGVNGWKMTAAVPNGFAITNGWSGNYTVNGTSLIISNAAFNGELPAGGSVSGGFNYSSPSAFSAPSGVSFNGSAAAVSSSSQNNNNNNNQNNNNNNNNQNNQPQSADVKTLLQRSPNAKQGDDWLHVEGNKIVDKDGKQVWLTGVNWFGYNTGTNIFDGLWNSELVSSVKGIADHGFNLIRVPISAQLLNQWAAGEYPKANYNNAYNPTLNNMNSLEIFDYFLKLAEENGMKVMPDIHCAETDAAGHNVNLWYTDRVTAEDYYRALEWLADRYKNNDTIIAIDLKNEPHGKQNETNKAIWNNSTDKNNWKYVAETAAKRILAKNPNVLIMVEGTEIYPISASNMDYHSQNAKDYYFNWWGGNLRGVKDYPVDLGKYQNKLVYSPHDYGPTVYEQPWFKSGYNYDSLMKDCWQDNWLYIHTSNTAPLLIGEWGGFMRDPNLTWMTCMRKLIKNYHLNHTFWCYNANSGDTGGLVLDDFKTWDTEKYNFVKEVLWQENGKFVGLDHAIPLGENGISVSASKGLK